MQTEIPASANQFTAGAADEKLATENFEEIARISKLSQSEEVGSILQKKDQLIDNLPELERIIASLSDEKSREVLRGIIRYNLYGSTAKKAEVIQSIQEECQWPSPTVFFDLDDDSRLQLWNDENQYYPEDLREHFDFSDNEVFLDVGAFDGCNIWQFHKIFGGDGYKTYAFEPNKANFIELQKMVEPLDKERVRTFNYGLSSEPQTLYLPPTVSPSSYGKKEQPEGWDACSFDRIETLLSQDEQDSVTIIKIDVEGAEMDVLRSLEPLIRKTQPRVLVSLYHRMQDLYEIPTYVQDMLPDRKLYVRHHTNWFLETVLYAL